MSNAKMRRLVAAATLFALTLTGAGVGAAMAIPLEAQSAMDSGTPAAAGAAMGVDAAAGDDLLTDIGKEAINDLRKCLASNSQLDVYYLIDASGSLWDDEDTPKPNDGTDVDMVRAELIANSLKELVGLDENLTVNYALGFFGDDLLDAKDWTAVTDPDAEAKYVHDKISNQSSLGWTDWKKGIEGAREQLAGQNQSTQGCQLLVWLTDGGLNLQGHRERSEKSLSELCGREAPVGSGALHSTGSGTFNELRQAGIVVIGVLLDVSPADKGKKDPTKFDDTVNKPYMRALVEGKNAKIPDDTFYCGEYPIPEKYVRGAVVEATNVDDLARVFVELGVAVAGGYSAPFGIDGTFAVDPGIASFTIVTSSTTWTIKPENGPKIDDESPGKATVTKTSGITRIDVPTAVDAAETWKWTSNPGAKDGLAYFSPLFVTIDQPITFVAGEDNLLTVKIDRTDNRDVPLTAYNYDLKLFVLAPDGETEIAKSPKEIDENQDAFEFHYSATTASGIVTLQARVDNISTKPNGINVSSVFATRDVNITLPIQYPTISPQPLILSEMVGSKGVAKATFAAVAPSDGSEGELCFPDGLVPNVINDAAKRAESWVWASDVTEECIKIAAGTNETFSLSVSNEIAAYSNVEAVLNVVYKSEAGDALEGALPIEFSTTKPLNAGVFGAVATFLLLLGILGPLALLLLFTWLTHKITRGSRIQRASFPVFVQADGRVLDAQRRPLSETDFGTEHFEFLGTEADSRQMRDSGIGALISRISLNPFGRPWFEVQPNTDRAVIGSSGFLPAKRDKLAARARIAGFNGDLGAAWALILPDSALDTPQSDTDPVSGTLVVYLRNTTNNKAAMQQRMADILVARSLADRIDRARSLRADEARAAKAKAKPEKRNLKDATSAPPQHSAHVPSGDDPPTRQRTSASSDSPPPTSARRSNRSGSSSTVPQSDNRRSGVVPPASDRRSTEGEKPGGFDDPPPSASRSR